MKKVKLFEIAEIRNGSTPSTANSDHYDGDISWATPKDLSDSGKKYFYSGERNITEIGASSIGGIPIPENSLLLTSRAPIGLLAINKKETFTNQGFKNIILDESKASIEYLYYFLKQNISFLINLGGGTTFKEISKTVLEQFEFPLPSLPTQQKIADILSALDDKIELNRKVNSELEKLARTIYDYWFLQFDFPDANGAPYRTSGGVMTYSKVLKREIPDGWEVKNMSDLTEIRTGKKDANFGVENGKYDFWTTSDTPIRANDFSFSGKSILIAGNGNFYVNLTDGDFEAYQRTYVIQASNERDLYLMYFATLTAVASLRRGSNGSIIKFITLGDVENISQAYQEDTVIKFDKQVKPIFEKIQKNNQESRELAELRDWLLPMLMNGQISV